MDSYLLDEFQALVAERGLTVLRWVELGGQNFYGKKPILWPEDVRGYRMRASTDAATKVIWEVLDADLIFLPSSDLIPALQTGLLDGGAAVPLVYGGIGISEQASHYTVSNHFYIGALLMANTRWLESLPDNSDRFTHWPVRIDKGGEMLPPGDPRIPMEYIDVRDLAVFLMLLAEKGECTWPYRHRERCSRGVWLLCHALAVEPPGPRGLRRRR